MRFAVALGAAAKLCRRMRRPSPLAAGFPRRRSANFRVSYRFPSVLKPFGTRLPSRLYYKIRCPNSDKAAELQS